MISDMTLGQFFPGFSPIHKLDPRTKILLAILFIVTIFLADTPLSFLVLTILTLLLIPISKISARVIFRGIRPILLILLFTSVLNLFMTGGEGEPLVAFWVFRIYREGIIRAVLMSLRVVLLVIGTSLLLTYTTSPISLTDGLDSLLSPLNLLHVPVQVFSMMMTIALRFIPTLVEETEKIMNAQKSRGADFTSGSLFRRAKALIPLLVPLFVSAFKRAEELAVAMECRCYRVGGKRTKMVKLTLRARDFLWMFLGVLVLGTVIVLRIYAGRTEVNAGVWRILLFRI